MKPLKQTSLTNKVVTFNEMLKSNVQILCLLAFFNAALSREYLEEKPDFFRACTSQDVDFNKCYTKNIQALIYNFRYGIPGLTSVGKFEPVKIRKLHLEQNQLKIEMRNITIKGLGATSVIDSRINPKTFNFKLKVIVPKLRIDGKYKTDGRIMFLPINGNGKMWLEAENISLIVNAKIKLDNDLNITFADILRIKTKIKNIDGFHANLENLFNGNIELESHANAIFNENWREIIDLLRPTLEEGTDAVLLGRFKRIFNYIPAAYLITDIPNAPKLNATEVKYS